MQREILFRGKRVDNGEWVEGHYWINKYRKTIQHKIGEGTTNSSVNGFEVIPKTVSQFTGAKLIKGDKVFDGTIAFHENELEEDDERTYLICTYIHEWFIFAWLTSGELIAYQDNGIKALDATSFFTYTMEDSHTYHHAGNIFDNPKLLE